MWLLLLLAAAAATPAPTPAPAFTTVVLQQGYNGYTGAVDVGALSVTPMDSVSPMVRIGRNPSVTTTTALLYWDLSSIPAGAACSSMSLTTTWNISSTTTPFANFVVIYRAIVPWNASTTTYAMSISDPAQIDNATSTPIGTLMQTATPLVPSNLTLDISITGCCWLSGTCPNYGVFPAIFQSAGGGNFYVYEAEAPQAYRPILSVTYYIPLPPDLCGYAYYAHNATEAAPAVYAGVWGITMRLFVGGVLNATATTASDGTFCFRNVSAGNYSIVASSLEFTNGLAAGPIGTAGSGRIDNINITSTTTSLTGFAFGMVQSCLNPYGNCTWVNNTVTCTCTDYGQPGELVYDSYSNRCVPLLDWVTYGCDPFSIAGAPCTVCIDNMTLVTVPLAAGGSTAYCVPSTCAPTCACCSWDTTRCVQCNAGYNLNGGDGSCAPAPTASPTAAPTALPTTAPTSSPTPAPTPFVSACPCKRQCAV